MKRCNGCGAVVKDEDRFCPACGGNDFFVENTAEGKVFSEATTVTEPKQNVQTDNSEAPGHLDTASKKGLTWWMILLIAIVSVAGMFVVFNVFSHFIGPEDVTDEVSESETAEIGTEKTAAKTTKKNSAALTTKRTPQTTKKHVSATKKPKPSAELTTEPLTEKFEPETESEPEPEKETGAVQAVTDNNMPVESTAADVEEVLPDADNVIDPNEVIDDETNE